MSKGTDKSDEEVVPAVRIGKRTYATNLLWEIVDTEKGDTARAHMKAARAHPSARDVGAVRADFYLRYDSPAPGSAKSVQQVAFGHKAVGHRRGMFSLAAAFALAHPPDTDGTGDDCGLFEVEGGLFYVVAISRGMILADTDAIFAEQGLAFEEFSNLVNRPGFSWRHIYCPEFFGFDGATDTGLAEAIAAKKVPQLREFVPVSAMVKAAAGLVAVGAVVAAIMVYRNHEAKLAAIAAREHAAALQRIRAEQVARARAAAGPWKDQPEFSAALRACVNEMLTLPKTVPGWDLSSVNCNGRTLGARYTVQPIGTIAWLYSEFEGVPIKWDGKTATVTWKLQGIATERHEKASGNISYMTEWVGSHLQEVFADWAVTPRKKAPVRTPPPRPGAPRYVPPFFPSVDVTVKTTAPPVYLLPVLGQIPAFVLDNVSYKPKLYAWVVKGHFYGKPVKPKQQEKRR